MERELVAGIGQHKHVNNLQLVDIIILQLPVIKCSESLSLFSTSKLQTSGKTG